MRLLSELDKAPPRLRKAVADAKASGLIAEPACKHRAAVAAPKTATSWMPLPPFLKEGYEIITV